MRDPKTIVLFLLILISKIYAEINSGITEKPWGYVFKGWKGPPVDVHVYIPPRATRESPMLIVMPGRTRDTQIYHAPWVEIAKKKLFVLLTVGVRKSYFPDDFSYGAGRVISSEGYAFHEDNWLFSVIEPMFEDFKKRYKFKAKKFYIFGSSSGADFVHRYLLFKPNAPVLKAVSSNPTSVTILEKEIQYPYGLKNAPLKDNSIKSWLLKDHLVVAWKEDIKTSTNYLENSVLNEVQGTTGYERGGFLYTSVKQKAHKRKAQFGWELITLSQKKYTNFEIARIVGQRLFDK